MKIELNKKDRFLEIKLEGRLDTNTSSELENKMEQLENIDNLVNNLNKKKNVE